MKKIHLLLIGAVIISCLSSFSKNAHAADETISAYASQTLYDAGYFMYGGQQYHAYGDGSGNVSQLWTTNAAMVDQVQMTGVSGTYGTNRKGVTIVSVVWNTGYYSGPVYY